LERKIYSPVDKFAKRAKSVVWIILKTRAKFRVTRKEGKGKLETMQE